MDKNVSPAPAGAEGLGPRPSLVEDQAFGLQAPVEYKGHPADGSNPAISMPSFPPKGKE